MQSASGVFGLKLTMAVAPALGLIGGAIMIWNYPLTRARVEEIQTQLAERDRAAAASARSEEHTSELQSLMRISYTVFCLKKKTTKYQQSCHISIPRT